MTRIVDTLSVGFPIIEGIPFTNYNADEVFISQMNKYFPGLFSFKVVSRRGTKTRTDVLLKVNFAPSIFSDRSFYVYVFVLYEGGKGRAHADELRTQLTAPTSWSPDISNIHPAISFRDNELGKETAECYCIGIYKQNLKSDNVAFVGMPSEVLCKSECENINPTSAFQTYGELLRYAYIEGVYLHKKNFTASSTYNLLNFKPQYFLWYMKHRDQIHVKDIDKALDVLKTANYIEPIPEIDADSRQIIYYGAPGTGKSYKIKGLVRQGNHVRTTFHPDSDYASFVGAYKPTMIEISSRDMAGHVILDNGVKVKEKKIVYEFVAQAFLQAYTEAWKRSVGIMINKKGINIPMPEGEDDKYYLVIEEINRGNCAQIFGDLFQLLDRDDNGESSYAIRPDQDMKRYLAGQFKDIEALPEAIRTGEEMKLPSNLYIFATMNTSDQSLFPIDSAFKRRWDWEYVPIKDEKKGYYIKIGDKTYLWSDFIEKVNNKILDVTHSDDKQMGYWFVHLPEGRKEISIDKFVGKVLFYLWNDVFKDFGDGEDTIFMSEKENGHKLRFKDFFGENREECIKDLMRHNKVEPTEIDDDDEAQDILSGEVKPVSSEVKEWQAQFDNYWKGLQEYWEKDPDIKSRFKRIHSNAMVLAVDGTDEIRMRFSMHPTHWHKVSINLRVKDGSPESQALKESLDDLRKLTGEADYQYVVDRNYGLVQLRSAEIDFENPDDVRESYEWLLTQSHKLLKALNTIRLKE